MIINKIVLTANTTWLWTENTPEYPATDYSLRAILRNGSGNSIVIDSEANGSLHDLSKDKTDTALLPAGLYSYQIFAVSLTDATLIYFVAEGSKEILADITTADARGNALTMVEKLRAAYLALASGTMAQVGLGDRSWTYKTLAELRLELTYWENQAGLSNSNKRRRILNHFSND